MKMKMALATAAFILFGSVAANAQLTFSLDPTSPIDPSTIAGGAYAGTITNPTAGNILLDGGSFTVPAGVGLLDNFTDLAFTDLPITLKPGDFYSLDPFLEINSVPAGFPGGVGTYFLTSGGTIVGSATFNIPGTTAVPEPGALALLGAGFVGSGLMLARRRRK